MKGEGEAAELQSKFCRSGVCKGVATLYASLDSTITTPSVSQFEDCIYFNMVKMAVLDEDGVKTSQLFTCHKT